MGQVRNNEKAYQQQIDELEICSKKNERLRDIIIDMFEECKDEEIVEEAKVMMERQGATTENNLELMGLIEKMLLNQFKSIGDITLQRLR